MGAASAECLRRQNQQKKIGRRALTSFARLEMSLECRIYSDLFGGLRGLVMKALMLSQGYAASPTPPRIERTIQPVDAAALIC